MRRKSLMTPTPVGCGFAWTKAAPLMTPADPCVVRFSTAGTRRSSRDSSCSRASGKVFRGRGAQTGMGATLEGEGHGPAVGPAQGTGLDDGDARRGIPPPAGALDIAFRPPGFEPGTG